MALKRLDVLLVERGLASSRELAQSLILSGSVWSGEQRLEKAGTRVNETIALEIRVKTTPFASRAGQKLQFAVEKFAPVLAGRTCLDVGASTGGFTDCLLKNGAARVFAVDVGYGQLEQRLRGDTRVVVLERINARFLTQGQLRDLHPDADRVDFLCIDVSFISLAKVLEPLLKEFASIREVITLFKPQFEVGRAEVGKGGLVRSEAATQSALEKFNHFMEGIGFRRRGVPESSPVAGKKSGNVEYLIHYEKIRA